MLDHLPLPRHQLQRLGHILAQLVQGSAAARACARRRVDHALARQVFRQRPARRLAAIERLHGHARGLGWPARLCRSLGLSLIFLELEQLQLELVEQRTTFRRLAEPLVPQPGDHVAQLLDLQAPSLGLVLGRRGARFGQPQRRTLCHDQRLQRVDVVRQGLSGRSRHSAIVAPPATEATSLTPAKSSCRISLQPAAAMSCPAGASRCLPAGSRAAPH